MGRYGDTQAEREPVVRSEPLRLEIQGFLVAVRGDGAIVSAADAIAALRVAEQINVDINARARGRDRLLTPGWILEERAGPAPIRDGTSP